MKRYAWVECDGVVVFVGSLAAARGFYLRRYRRHLCRLCYVYQQADRPKLGEKVVDTPSTGD